MAPEIEIKSVWIHLFHRTKSIISGGLWRGNYCLKRVKQHHLSPCEDTVLLKVKSAPVEFGGIDYSIFFSTCSLDHIPINTHQRISKGKDTSGRELHSVTTFDSVCYTRTN